MAYKIGLKYLMNVNIREENLLENYQMIKKSLREILYMNLWKQLRWLVKMDNCKQKQRSIRKNLQQKINTLVKNG